MTAGPGLLKWYEARSQLPAYLPNSAIGDLPLAWERLLTRPSFSTTRSY